MSLPYLFGNKTVSVPKQPQKSRSILEYMKEVFLKGKIYCFLTEFLESDIEFGIILEGQTPFLQSNKYSQLSIS